MRLRDHDRPCEHGKDQNLEVPLDHYAVYKCDAYGCPGGAEIVIDFEAAETAHSRYNAANSRSDTVRHIIAAALSQRRGG